MPYVTVTGYVDLECPDGDGVDVVQDALQAAEGNGEIPVRAGGPNGSSGDEQSESSGVPEEIELSVTYVGAPEYRIEVKAPDYKTAEDHLEQSAERAIRVIGDNGGTGEFHRERREDEE